MLRDFDLGRPKAWPDANKLLNPTPYTEGAAPAAVKRYTFSRDAAYAKKLKAVASLDESRSHRAATGAKCLTDPVFRGAGGYGAQAAIRGAGRAVDEQTLRALPAGKMPRILIAGILCLYVFREADTLGHIQPIGSQTFDVKAYCVANLGFHFRHSGTCRDAAG